MLKTASLILVALAATWVAGCGDGDGAGAKAAPPALAKAEYLRRAERICRQDELIDRRASTFFAGHSRKNPPSAAKQARFVDEVVIPTHQRQLDDLRALPIPAGDDDQLQPFLTAGQAFIDELKTNPMLYVQQRVTPALEQAARKAAHYGLRGCTP